MIGLLPHIVEFFVFVGLWVFVQDHLPHADGVTWKEQIPGAVLVAVGAEVLQIVTIVWFTRSIENKSDDLRRDRGCARDAAVGVLPGPDPGVGRDAQRRAVGAGSASEGSEARAGGLRNQRQRVQRNTRTPAASNATTMPSMSKWKSP